jgi:hypothetical protein
MSRVTQILIPVCNSTDNAEETFTHAQGRMA